MTRLVLIDDHEVAREGLRDVLADLSDVEVVGEVADGREALELCRRVRPDLVLMDLRVLRSFAVEVQEAPKVPPAQNLYNSLLSSC